MKDNIQVGIALVVGLVCGVAAQMVAVALYGVEMVAAGGLGTAVAFTVGLLICQIKTPKKGDS